MNHAANCKFCKVQVLIQIDDDYAALGDPLNILHFAACNSCADLRERKRNIEEAIKRTCIGMIQLGRHLKSEQVQKARVILIELTKRYAMLIAEWHHMSGMAWEPEFAELLIDKPGQWPKILTGYWKHFKEVFRNAQTAAA